MFRKSEGSVLEKNRANDVLRKKFYDELLKMKDDIQLDKSLFGFFYQIFPSEQGVGKIQSFS